MSLRMCECVWNEIARSASVRRRECCVLNNFRFIRFYFYKHTIPLDKVISNVLT